MINALHRGRILEDHLVGVALEGTDAEGIVGIVSLRAAISKYARASVVIFEVVARAAGDARHRDRIFVVEGGGGIGTGRNAEALVGIGVVGTHQNTLPEGHISQIANGLIALLDALSGAVVRKPVGGTRRDAFIVVGE